MAHFVGLDVSLKETSVCVVDQTGKVVCERSPGTSSSPATNTSNRSSTVASVTAPPF